MASKFNPFLKRVVYPVALTLLSFLFSSTVYAEHYLSRNICQIEFETLKKHNGHIARTLTATEKLDVLKQLNQFSPKACLTNREKNWDTDKANQKGHSRQKPFVDRCSALPKHYYADANGRTVYILSDHQMQKIEAAMIEDELLSQCVSPLIDF